MRFNDRITAARIRDGDVNTFEGFIDQYQDKIFNYCLRLSNKYEFAEELTQEAFIKFYQNIETYDYKKASLSTWLFRIAHNLSINAIRDNCHSANELTMKEESTSSTLEDQLIMKEKYDDLLAALQKLPPEGRQMVLLKDYFGFSCHELADMFNIPEGTVKSRLHKLRSQLREMLGDYDD